MNKTLYISDLDGTLLNKSAKLSEYTTKSLNNMIEKGLNFSVATARMTEPVRKMLSDVNVSVPVILLNGVLVYDMLKDEYIKINRLLDKAIVKTIEEAKNFDIIGFMYEINDGKIISYYEMFGEYSMDEYMTDRIARYKTICPVNGFSGVSSDNIIYFVFAGEKNKLKVLHDIIKELPDLNQTLYKNVYTEDTWYLDVYSPQSSKQSAINYLKEKYEFEQIISFGDQGNDLPMFEASDICIAVENAFPEVKQRADYICGSNETDGVVKWIEENYLEDKKEG